LKQQCASQNSQPGKEEEWSVHVCGVWRMKAECAVEGKRGAWTKKAGQN
jgi:hypothetical protein